MKIKCQIVCLAVSFFFMIIASFSVGNAASVREVSMMEMLQACQFVFEGKVLSRQAREGSGKRIHTFVTFAIEDIIKGEYSDKTIVLRFLGGTVGEITMAVSDMTFPEVGEHGVYFVESLERRQVNPLYGWKQGHFLVQKDDTATARVLTRSRRPVTGLTSNSAAAKRSVSLSTGVARGLVLGQKEGEKGLSLREFKKALRERLGEDK